MDENVNLFREVKGSKYMNLYLSTWKEFANIDVAIDLEKFICSSIHNTELCALTLRLLPSTKEELIWKHSYHWASKLIKLFVCCTENRKAHQIISGLGVLAKLCSKSQESRRLFGSHNVHNILNIITKEYSVSIDKVTILRCMILLLQLYPEYSIQSDGVIKVYLSNLADSQVMGTVEYSAKCYHLLLNKSKYKQRTVPSKDLWQAYQSKLCKCLRMLVDKLLGRCSSSIVEAIECEPLCVKILTLSDNPAERFPQIFTRLRNFAVYLIVTLRQPFSTEKLVNPNNVLHFLQSSIVSIGTISEKKTNHHIILDLLIPQLYYILLQVLEALITTLGSNLRRNYKIMWTILGDILNLSTTKLLLEENPSYMRLRAKLCYVISSWCTITGQGSRGDIIQSLTTQLILDMYPPNNILQKSINGCFGAEGDTCCKIIHEVISSAQTCLFEILNSSPNRVACHIAKTLKKGIINSYALMYDVTSRNNDMVQIRNDFLQVHLALLTSKNRLSLSYAQVLLNFTRHSDLANQNKYNRGRSTLISSFMEKSIHPGKESLVYKTPSCCSGSLEKNTILLKPSYVCDGRTKKCHEKQTIDEKKVKNVESGENIWNFPANNKLDTVERNYERALPIQKGTNFQQDTSDDLLIENIITEFIDELS